jgi:hypothetical protein
LASFNALFRHDRERNLMGGGASIGYNKLFISFAGSRAGCIPNGFTPLQSGRAIGYPGTLAGGSAAQAPAFRESATRHAH